MRVEDSNCRKMNKNYSRMTCNHLYEEFENDKFGIENKGGEEGSENEGDAQRIEDEDYEDFKNFYVNKD